MSPLEMVIWRSQTAATGWRWLSTGNVEEPKFWTSTGNLTSQLAGRLVNQDRFLLDAGGGDFEFPKTTTIISTEAEDHGVRLVLANCSMPGKNLAAWSLSRP